MIDITMKQTSSSQSQFFRQDISINNTLRNGKIVLELIESIIANELRFKILAPVNAAKNSTAKHQ